MTLTYLDPGWRFPVPDPDEVVSSANATPSSSTGGERMPATSQLLDRDRYFEVTIRSWKGQRTSEVRESLTQDEVQAANSWALATTGWPVHIRPADVAALRTTAKSHRGIRAVLLRWRSMRS